MSGGEKKKLQYDAWVERQPFNARPDFLRMNFEDLDSGFQKCEDILSRVSLNIGFASKINKIYEVVEATTKLIRYIDGLPWDIGSLMDDPLKKNFNLHATESISRIHAEDISTNNTIGIKKFSAGRAGTSYGQYGSQSTEEVKVEKIKFQDFMDENTTGGEYRQKFADLFKADYEVMVKAKEFGKDSGIENYDDYVGVLIKQGEFDHKMEQPFKQFISGLLDLTIIKPLIEMSTGTEMITNEDLTDTEKLYKGIGAIIDISTLGYAMVARKAIGGVLSASKVLLLESISNGAAYITAYAGDKLNLPVAITMLLTLGVGIKVGKQGSKYVVKSKTGEILGEVASEAGDKSLFDITETLLKTGDAKTVGSVLDTFDIKSMSKEEINSLYDTLSKGKLTKVEIERFQKVLMGNIEGDGVPDIIKGSGKAIERELKNEFINEFDAKGYKEFLERTNGIFKTEEDAYLAFSELVNRDFKKFVSHLDLSTEKDCAYFWSGEKDIASSIASSNGGTIMESTQGGKVIDKWDWLNEKFPADGNWGTGNDLDPQPLWKATSKAYAKGVSGKINYVNQTYEGKVWLNDESRIVDILMDKGIVTEVNYYNKEFLMNKILDEGVKGW